MKRLTIVLLAALLLGGCGWFEDPSPKEARLVVDGDPSKIVRLIVSTKFVAAVNDQGQTRVVIFEADTLLTSLPYEQAYDIEEDQRFFVETARVADDFESVRVQVFVDRGKQYDEGGMLLEGDPFRFVYTFNQAVTREIIVI